MTGTSSGRGQRPYRGRFAPSPTGPLHAGSLVSALASWLDARAHGGEWLVRIEDVDAPRTVPGADTAILQTLARYGLHPDAPPVWQSARNAVYQTAFDQLAKLRGPSSAGVIYPCGCTRREIADALERASQQDLRSDSQQSVHSSLERDLPPGSPHQTAHLRHTTLAYPGTCRDGLHGRAPRAWRLRVPDGDAAVFAFTDRWQGPQTQDLSQEVGDFALKRADGLWAYQLAVVVDDAAFGITDIVRGADLLDSTPRQIYLQQCLHTPTPRYLHVPVLLDGQGEKLSKQTGAQPLPDDAAGSDRLLRQTATFLGLDVPQGGSRADLLAHAVNAWRDR